MEKKAETKKELIEDLADLLQQPADVRKSRSETKNLLQVLQASEVRYRRLFETAQDGILILNAETGEIDDVNPYMIDMLHYSREEFLGMKLWEVSPFKDTVLNRAAFEKLQDKGYIRYKDLALETKEGKPVAVEFVSNVYRVNRGKVIQCNIRNITERKEYEAELRNSKGRLHTLVQTIPDLIWLKDKDGVYLSCNTMFERFFGAREADIVGKTDYDFVDRELAESFREHDRKAMAAGKPTSKEEWITFADDGHRVFLETIKTPMHDARGTLIGVLGIGRDITDREQAIERTRKALGATVKAIAVIVEARDTYTAGHQWRVADLARAIATEINLSVDQIDGIRMAAAIHDLGKISFPAEILSKSTNLTNIEFRLIKTHSQSGYDILKDIDFPWPVARTVLEHHERMNGSGYPNGLTGDNILMESRILSVADVVEAMASHRPYRPSMGIEVALEEIEKNRGILYDNTVADTCLRLFRGKGYQLQ